MRNKYYMPLALLVAVAAFFTYLPALWCGFTNWDDEDIVFNPIIRSIDLNLLKWIFSAKANDTFGPLYFFSFALDYAAWGLNPVGYHFTNVILHTVNTFLLFVLCLLIGEQIEGKSASADCRLKILVVSFVTALLFGIHPLNVEAVTWIAARGGPLSGIFFLTSIYSYLKYGIGHKKPYLYASLILFTLAVLSKPTTATLPGILLIIDYALLKRVSFNKGLNEAKGVLLEKIPFFLIGLLLLGATAWLRQAGGYVVETEALPFYMRLSVAVRSIAFYLYKIMLPFNLAPIYSYPENINLLSLEYLGSYILLALITFFCIIYRKKSVIYISVWSYYIITLIPTTIPLLGVFRMGLYAEADRYAYIVSIGPFFVFGLVAAKYTELSSKKARYAVSAAIIELLCVLPSRSVDQILIWRNPVKLWSHQINLFPATYVAYNNRGIVYHRNGQYSEALQDFNRAIELYPRYSDAYSNRGSLYSVKGDMERAINDFTTAVKLDPRNAKAFCNRGIALSSLGKLPQAIADHTKAISINPANDGYYFNRGLARAATGEFQQAKQDFKKAVELNPYNSSAYFFHREMLDRLGEGK